MTESLSELALSHTYMRTSYRLKLFVCGLCLSQKKLAIITDCSILSAAIETHLVSYDGFVLVHELHL